jgi:hypothetical protein
MIEATEKKQPGSALALARKIFLPVCLNRPEMR